jgi:hypothetical protein
VREHGRHGEYNAQAPLRFMGAYGLRTLTGCVILIDPRALPFAHFAV